MLDGPPDEPRAARGEHADGGSRAIGGDDAKMSKDSLEGQQTEVVVSRLVKNGGVARLACASQPVQRYDGRLLRYAMRSPCWIAQG